MIWLTAYLKGDSANQGKDLLKHFAQPSLLILHYAHP